MEEEIGVEAIGILPFPVTSALMDAVIALHYFACQCKNAKKIKVVKINESY